MKKLFITGPRAIVSVFLLRNIEKSYSTEEIKDDGEKATVMMKEFANDKRRTTCNRRSCATQGE